MALYANIIVDISLEKLDKTFQYLVPEAMQDKLSEGMRVNIPFGKGNRQVKGYVLELTETPEFEIDRIKPITSIVTEEVAVESQMIALAAWIRKQYGGTMNQALKTVLPVKAKLKQRTKRTVRLCLDKSGVEKQLEEYKRRHYTARYRLLHTLAEYGELDYRLITAKLNINMSVIKAMSQKNIVEVAETTSYRNPLETMLRTAQPHWKERYSLNEMQMQAAEEIWEERLAPYPRPCLLHGVTGSGKTEIYMELIDRVLKEGRQAIVLIPEIALTFQTVMRFYYRFGGQVSIMNSKMSAGERYDQYLRAQKGEISVMVGPRSALFTPFLNLGIIIIDEEHESSYKSETTPKYHARETAEKIAGMNHALLVLGSATPSIASYYRTKTKEYRLFTISKRVAARPLPQVQIVDLREELKSGNRSVFSMALQKQIEKTLSGKEQAMLFLNRRGVAGFVSCRSCGSVMKCPHCDVSLSQHGQKRLVCHYCGYETGMPAACPQCGSKYIGGFRAGTEKIEQEIKKMYPMARVLRMDADTTKKKDGYEQLLSAFANHEADILIGTQMIVKGHDFPDVTLVGILSADMSLHISDYRASERTFQLLTQAAGRAGRGNKKGTVIIQAYQPEHYSIVTAKNQDYIGFYEQEMMYREMAAYPPVCNLMQIFLASASPQILQTAAELMKEQIQRINEKTEKEICCQANERAEKEAFRPTTGSFKMIGPTDAAISKVNDIYRKVIYLKHADYAFLVAIKDELEEYTKKCMDFRNIMVQYDFNPMNPL